MYRRFLLQVFIVSLASGCLAESSDETPDANETPTTETVAIESSKGRVSFKGGDRLARDLARALAVPDTELCRELELYDCVDVVHTVSLGGVEPYGSGIYEALETTSITTPIATERVVLSACQWRATRDFARPSEAAIFQVSVDAQGALLDVEATEVEQSIITLYQQILARRPETHEIQTVRDLYIELAELDGAPRAVEWATLSCFAVATTMESLFY